MKANLYDKSGKSKGKIDLPKTFTSKIREDIVQKFYQADKLIQPYSSTEKAGQKRSASGTVRHRRHVWKSHYGRGIARLPRKVMWRRGTQFYWVGAIVSGTKGGRRAHPPKGIGKEKKINKKEIQLAFNSALSSTALPEYITERYSSLKNSNSKLEFVPAVIDSVPEKTRDLKKVLESIFSPVKSLIFKKKSVRSGKGKSRGRKYKSSQGILIIKSRRENVKHSGIDLINTEDLTISDLYPLGRITLFTKTAIEELSKPQSSNGKENKK
jgi:large subunit ribosomal protein L4e